MPGQIYALSANAADGVLWVGGDEERVWRLDPVSLEIDRSISFDGTVFGLAWDGTYLWVGESGTGEIQQYDPAEDTVVARYDYPNAQTIYDYAYVDGNLWLLGDGVLYKTSVDSSIPNESPSASFTVSAGSVEPGEAVSFDASSSADPDGSIVSYDWDFGGGGSTRGSGRTTEHSYSTSGTYRVSLTVTDDAGGTDTASRTVTVTEANEGPTASFSVSPGEVRPGETVAFDASASDDPDGSITSYEWDFTSDESVDATGPTATHRYSDPGQVTVSLTVTDDAGATDRATGRVSIREQNEAPEARMSVSPSDPQVGQTVTFSAAASSDSDGSVSTYEWDLTGDGSVDATGQTVTYAYESSGEFWVTLTVVDDSGLRNEARNRIAVEQVESASEGGDAADGGQVTTIEPPETDEPTERATAGDETTLDGSGPRFGIGSAVAGVGGSLYFLKRRLSDQEESE